MTGRDDRFCRLCLSVISNKNFQGIGENIKKIVKANFHISAEHVICSNCTGSVQECLGFKSKFLRAEDFIVSLYNSETKTKLDLREVYIQGYRNMAIGDIARDQQICRFCLKLSSGSSCKPLIEIEDDIIQKCIPDLNFNLTRDPVICDSCQNSLKFHFKFLQTCADTEEKINKYCKFEEIGNEGPINLNMVVQFTNNLSLYKRDIAKEDVDLDGLCCETKNIIKTEEIIEKFDSQNIENDFKIDVGQNLKIEIKEEPFELQDEQLGSFLDASTSSQIIMKNINERMYNCEICSHATKRKGDLNMHMLIHRELSEITLYKCDSCSYVAKRKGGLRQHMLIHRELSEVIVHRCDHCSYVSKQKSNVKKHMLTHREVSEVTVYRCDSCTYVSKQKSNLKKHMLTHQELSEVIVYNCDSCSYVAKRKWDVKMHMLTHQALSEVKIYRCDICSYGAKQKGNLENHMLIHRELSQVMIYKCDSCSYVAKRKGGLKQHMMTHQEVSEVTVYRCDSCSYISKQKSNLRKHMLTHQQFSEVMVYKCDSCSYVAKRKGTLKQHMMTHRELSEVPVYRCDSCSYVSKQKYNLKKHMLTHQGLSEVNVNNVHLRQDLDNFIN